MKKAGCIIKKQIFTEKGADLECFSHPTLQFSIKELVDSENKPLAILEATLLVKKIQ
jgi:hypothetical protein